MWIFRKLALKILWNHFRWTYFWRIFAICNHCVLSWQRKVLLLFSAVSLSLWLLSLIVEQECLFSLLVLLSKAALKVSISVAISSQLFVKQLLFVKVEKILKGSLNHLHLQRKFKLWAGKFPWGIKAKHCSALSTNFENKKCFDITQ